MSVFKGYLEFCVKNTTLIGLSRYCEQKAMQDLSSAIVWVNSLQGNLNAKKKSPTQR